MAGSKPSPSVSGSPASSLTGISIILSVCSFTSEGSEAKSPTLKLPNDYFCLSLRALRVVTHIERDREARPGLLISSLFLLLATLSSRFVRTFLYRY
jgi:hypothetical protein